MYCNNGSGVAEFQVTQEKRQVGLTCAGTAEQRAQADPTVLGCSPGAALPGAGFISLPERQQSSSVTTHQAMAAKGHCFGAK